MKDIRKIILNVLKTNRGGRIEVQIKIIIFYAVGMHVRKIKLSFKKLRIECKEGRK